MPVTGFLNASVELGVNVGGSVSLGKESCDSIDDDAMLVGDLATAPDKVGDDTGDDTRAGDTDGMTGDDFPCHTANALDGMTSLAGIGTGDRDSMPGA